MLDKYKAWWVKGLHFITRFLSSLHWNGLRALFNGGVYYDLTEADHNELKRLLSAGYYIILTNRKSHLTTWLIGVLSFIKTRKWPSYSHTLMNIDSVEDPNQWDKFQLIEATNAGVHHSTFMQVFDCDAVCLLQPKTMNPEKWEAVMVGLAEQNGKAYDDLFDIDDDSHVSCVELALDSLRAESDYNTDFATLEAEMEEVGNLTPQMLRDCTDFVVVFERK